jgi:hypothetical protein
MESMLGFRQDLGFAGSVQSVAAVSIHPEIDGSEGRGLDEAAIRSWETIHLGDEFDAEVGSTEVVGRFSGQSPNTVTQALPSASVDWRKGNSTVGYRMATFIPGPRTREDTEAGAWLPRFAERNGDLVLEHGLHQEIGWERRTDDSGVAVRVFSDNVQNPVLEAMGRMAAADSDAVPLAALQDHVSNLLRVAGPNFSSAGMQASIERRLPRGNHVRLSYANGGALVMPVVPRPITLAQLVAASRPRHVQTYALSLSGTLDGTGTRWRASYRWQPEDTVTEVAPFAVDGTEPYLNLYVRQPIRLSRDGSGGFEALLDVRNLLADGYRPYILSDGSLLIFAQEQRSIRAGLVFTF